MYISHNYTFPFKEDFGIWSVIYNEVSSSIGYSKLQATIIPNYKRIMEGLVSQNYIKSEQWTALRALGELQNFPESTRAQIIQNWHINVNNYTISVANAVASFCESKKKTVEKSTFSVMGIFDDSNQLQTIKCVEAIKKDLVLSPDDVVLDELNCYLTSHSVYLSKQSFY
jgi:hypothetical protein